MEPSSQSSSSLLSDAEVVDRVVRGDVEAYALLVERYERAALAGAWPIVRDLHAAQDVVQDVFVHCYARLASLRDGSRFGPWLLKAVEREAGHASKRARRMRLVRSDHEPPAADDGRLSDDTRLFDDERQKLLGCVRALPAHERIAISLRYFEGRRVSEIAGMTGLAVGTITKQLSRALQRLREQLNQKESESWTPKTKSLVR